MSNQPENEQTEAIITPEEVRQYVLAEIDATKQVIAELFSDEGAGGGRRRRVWLQPPWQRLGEWCYRPSC